MKRSQHVSGAHQFVTGDMNVIGVYVLQGGGGV